MEINFLYWSYLNSADIGLIIVSLFICDGLVRDA